MKNPDRPALTISELTRLIRQSLESSFPGIWVEGEISNLKVHSSGHIYLTLKDEAAQISAVLWRSRVPTLAVRPEDGMKVRAYGSVTVYPPRGVYQLDVAQMFPLGVGELQLAFERLKRRLAAEGLFDQDRKRPLPRFPGRIGVVTSPTGAAFQDIRSVLERRFPSVEVVLCPVRVQGAGAAEEIADAIRMLNEYGAVDVMIVGRGGGSLEDLWPFNEEIVARAIVGSSIPVVSAVGHEVDVSIADFAADLRAPTPSAAAELVVPHRADVLETLRNNYYTIRQTVQELIRSGRERVRGLAGSYALNRPRDLLREHAQRVDELERLLVRSASRALQLARHRHGSLGQRLKSLGPHNVLRRGYAMVRRKGAVVTSAAALAPGDRADLQFHDGTVATKVEST